MDSIGGPVSGECSAIGPVKESGGGGCGGGAGAAGACCGLLPSRLPQRRFLDRLPLSKLKPFMTSAKVGSGTPGCSRSEPFDT